MKSSVGLIVVLLLLLAPVAREVEGQDAGPMVPDPTPFEQFAGKLKLDPKKQLPDVQKIFTAAAGEAAPVSQEMMRLRVRMVALDGKPDELAPVTAAFAAAAARMAAIEVRAFGQVQALLKPGQLSKSADAFVLMAGLFNPPTPRAPRSPRGGGGQ